MRTSMRALLPAVTESGTVSLKSLRPITQRLTCSVRRLSPLTLILTVTCVLKRFGVQVVSTKILCVLPNQSARTFVSVSEVSARGGRRRGRQGSGGEAESDRREEDAPHMLSAYSAKTAPTTQKKHPRR